MTSLGRCRGNGCKRNGKGGETRESDSAPIRRTTKHGRCCCTGFPAWSRSSISASFDANASTAGAGKYGRGRRRRDYDQLDGCNHGERAKALRTHAGCAASADKNPDRKGKSSSGEKNPLTTRCYRITSWSAIPIEWYPLSTYTTEPVIPLASGLERKAAVCPTSSA